MCEIEKENANLKKEVEELKKQLAALCRRYESSIPFMCCDKKCKNRKCHG